MMSLVLNPKSVQGGDIGRSLRIERSGLYPAGYVYLGASGTLSTLHGLHLSREEALRVAVAILRIATEGP